MLLMLSNWDRLGRFGLDATSAATSFGFAAAKNGTKLGFAVTRGIASSAAGLTGSVVDYAVFGGRAGAGPALGGLVSSAISALESCTLAPIALGESVASTALVAADSSLSILQGVFPGSDETNFSLASFVTLVRREWNDDMQDSTAPKEKYGVAEVMKALVAWAALQSKTSTWQERRWFKHLKEVNVNDRATIRHRTQLGEEDRHHVPRSVVFSNQILTADIGEAMSPTTGAHDAPGSMIELKTRLRRFSQLVLAGYGGASLLFFGVPPVPNASLAGISTKDEEAQLAKAINSSEDQAAGSVEATPDSVQGPGTPSYSWWDVLLGKHDGDILLHYAKLQAQPSEAPSTEPPVSLSHPPIDATLGENSALTPRFWILTDHARREVVLVLRGTMSLNELAVDLTCDPADFYLHKYSSNTEPDTEEDLNTFDDQLESIPGAFPIDISTPAISPRVLRRKRSHHSISSEEDARIFQVHGGMLKMAQAMGGRGQSVHVAVRKALRRNEGYDLVICGHSLGAGVAALFALMWADPWTCLTHGASGLPSGRHVAAYCYAPPCLVSARLSQLAALSNLITSFVYSYDIVSRLSLGSVRDLRRAAAWLCEAEKEGRGDGYSGISAKILKAKTGFGKGEDQEWFIAIRKTLEANMHMAHLYPPGRVLWAIRDGDLDPVHRLASSHADPDKLRLFEIQDVEKVFGQIVFATGMLSSHSPHQYDKTLHELI